MENKFRIFNTFENNHNCYKFVNLDNYVIKKSPGLICTDSIISNLALTLYDPKNKVGAVAHIAGWDGVPEAIKPEKIVSTLCRRLSAFGDLNPKRLEATLSGEGGRISGRRNSSVVRSQLQKYRIPIIGEDLGKSYSRLIFLHCDNGEVDVHRERGIC